jgi:hypothetical protein
LAIVHQAGNSTAFHAIADTTEPASKTCWNPAGVAGLWTELASSILQAKKMWAMFLMKWQARQKKPSGNQQAKRLRMHSPFTHNVLY